MATARVGSADDQPMLRPVTNTLPTVTTKSTALARQGGEPGERGSSLSSEGEPRGATSSVKDVPEGGGESVESGCEAGIDDSYVCVQPKLAARKGWALADF